MASIKTNIPKGVANVPDALARIIYADWVGYYRCRPGGKLILISKNMIEGAGNIRPQVAWVLSFIRKHIRNKDGIKIVACWYKSDGDCIRINATDTSGTTFAISQGLGG